MQEQRFSEWLARDYRTASGSIMDAAARASRLSNCRRIEQYLGDLDQAYEADRMESLIARLELTRNETTPRHDIPIDGNLYDGTATLKSAARLYQKFRASTGGTAQTSPTRVQTDQLDDLDSQLRISLADATRRKQAAALMGRLIDLAARAIPDAWVLSWRKKRGIFLSLTFYRVFAIDRNRLFIAFTTSDASPELKAAVERARIARRTLSSGFLSLDDTTSAYVPASFYFENREALEALIERLAIRITETYDSTAFSRFHSPVAVEWVATQIGRDLPSPGYTTQASDAQRADEVSQLVDEFETWCETEKGKAHLQTYAPSRENAAKNLAAIRAARAAGEDITDLVLRGIVPHLDTQKNRERDAWTTIASAVAGDIRTKFQRTDEEWQRIAARIFDFIEAALADPGNIESACRTFARSSEARSFQSGMLSPFLNAIAPEHFAILNKKSRLATTYISGSEFGQHLEEYPRANELIRATAAQVGDLVDAPALSEVPDIDLYDAFSHWLVSERRFFDEEDADEPILGPRAFELFSLLDANPSGTVYQEHKNEFRAHIEEPFRRLLEAVAQRLTPEMQNALETRKNLFGRFLKNDFGRGGAWPYYWGAFYPKETQRVRGTQLFVDASSRYVMFGFFAGEPHSDAGSRAAAYLRNAERLAADGVDRVLTGYAFGDGSRVDDDTLFPTLESCLASGDEADLLDIRKILRPEEVTTLGVNELADIIAESFRELYPVMRVAIGELDVDREDVQSEPTVTPRALIEGAAVQHFEIAPHYTLDDLVRETGIAAEDAAMWVRAIERKKQAIFYGPPGTGKTFVAERVARHLVADADGFTETLQFHPAYSYEDFMEGMRPQSSGSGLTYPVVPGRFRSFCERASQQNGTCVLIIDEINRANLARVMGELMYLLEYRDKSVPLASGTLFTIPKNVRIIGTMNTADRSIALVDHALRRRFAFIALHPDYRVLTQFHDESQLSQQLVALLQEINKPIDPHYRVGISFFMTKPLEQHLSDIWRMEIEPYLEEYFFDNEEKCREMRWERVVARLPLTPVTLLSSEALTAGSENDDDQPAEGTFTEPRD